MFSGNFLDLHFEPWSLDIWLTTRRRYLGHIQKLTILGTATREFLEYGKFSKIVDAKENYRYWLIILSEGLSEEGERLRKNLFCLAQMTRAYHRETKRGARGSYSINDLKQALPKGTFLGNSWGFLGIPGFLGNSWRNFGFPGNSRWFLRIPGTG